MRLESETPRFPPEMWETGRIRCGEAVIFPNLVPYAKWSSVSVYSAERHVIPLGELTPRLLADAPLAEYAAAERDGERHIASGAQVDWIAGFAPIGPGEVRGVVSAAQLDDETVNELAEGIARILDVYAELGYESFNLALSGGLVRVVARAYYGPLARSDAMWSERLHWEAATDLAPERVAELARTRFA